MFLLIVTHYRGGPGQSKNKNVRKIGKISKKKDSKKSLLHRVVYTETGENGKTPISSCDNIRLACYCDFFRDESSFGNVALCRGCGNVYCILGWSRCTHDDGFFGSDFTSTCKVFCQFSNCVPLRGWNQARLLG